MGDEEHWYAICLLETPYKKLVREGKEILLSLQDGDPDLKAMLDWKRRADKYFKLFVSTPNHVKEEIVRPEASEIYKNMLEYRRIMRQAIKLARKLIKEKNMSAQLTGLISEEYNKLKNDGAVILRGLQSGDPSMAGMVPEWMTRAEGFLASWETMPDAVKNEACPDADRNFKLQIFSLGNLIDKAISLRDSSKHDEKQFPLPWDPVVTDEDKIRPTIDQIIEERGKVHGDANNSGKFFYAGVELLRDVNENSDIPRPDAFNGHIYMAIFKMLRLMHNPYHKDNYDDLLGYLRLAMDTLEDKKNV